MWEKIKLFFLSKTVQIVEWIVLGLAIAGLLLAGIAAKDITSYVSLVFAILALIGLLISFIIGKLK